MERLKIGDETEALVDGFDDKGRGTLLAGAKRALAYFVIPGEKIFGKITNRREGLLRIKAEKILEPSPDRVSPRCQYAGRCGGCPWQMVAYERQCGLKLELVNRAFEEFGVLKDFKMTAENFTPAGEQYWHRNRMDYVFGWRGELGLKEPEHWSGVLDIENCHLLSPEAVQAMLAIRAWMKKYEVTPWDNKRHTGFLRYVVIREGKNTNERMVLITTSPEQETLPHEDELVAIIRPLATSFIHGTNPEITDLSIPKTIRPLFGNPYLTEKVNGLEYRIPAGSFFQTNTQMAGVLQNLVVEFAGLKKTETALDLYCGNGFLTLALAQNADKIAGVEIDPASIDNARVNAELNSIKNVAFSAGATEALLPATLEEMKPDCIVVDPPRVGLHPLALQALAGYGAKRLVYVSCNPRSLARDLKTLLSVYEVDQIRSVDLFPHTPHIETVISLKKK